MSNNALGDTTTADPDTMTVDSSTEDISAGDAVAIDQSASDNRNPEVVQLDNGDTNEDQLAGVALEDIANGETGTILVAGGVIANIASGVSQGERLGSGATAGRFASSDGGNAIALSNEGGTDRAGTDLSANEAEVYL